MSFFPTQNFRMPAALACFLLTAIIGLGLDQWSKIEAFSRLASGIDVHPDGTASIIAANPPHDEYVFIPGLLHFTVVLNPGAVFGFGSGKQNLFRVVSVGAILFIFYLFAHSGRQRLYQILLGMLLAGVLGNLYDRIRFGVVRDMIHGLPHWHGLFPYIFNVADTFLCTGVGLMIVYSLFTDPGKPTAEADEVRTSASS